MDCLKQLEIVKSPASGDVGHPVLRTGRSFGIGFFGVEVE